MTGRLVRLRLRYQDERRGQPETLIAKFSAADPTALAIISALGHYEREVRFYELLSSRTPVPTPHCYYSHLNPDTGSALLVLEDLARAENGNSIAGCIVEQVARVLATLARMHAAWWQAADLTDGARVSDQVGDVLDRRDIANSIDATPSQVALSWLIKPPTVTAPMVGAKTLKHLEVNLAGADLELDAASTQRLDDVSAPTPEDYPYGPFGEKQRGRYEDSSEQVIRELS
jgi:hypothetical protein